MDTFEESKKQQKIFGTTIFIGEIEIETVYGKAILKDFQNLIT
jgi:hypothetical protein